MASLACCVRPMAAFARAALHARRAFASSSAPPSSSSTYDAIIVGGGHNGLVAAAYLARAGKRVVVLERRHLVGGAAVTEEIVPGFHFSRASYVYSLFRPQIVADLDLHRHGLTLLPRIPSSFTPSPDAGGRSLLLGGGAALDREQIAQFSHKDAEAYSVYNALLDKYAAVFRPMLDRPPPDLAALLDSDEPLWARLENLRDTLAAARGVASLGTDLTGFLEFLYAPANKILDRWFEGDVLKATLATDAIIGAAVAPSTPSSAYVLLHHVMCGTWCNVKGGMGALSQAVARAAVDAGAEIRLNSTVKRILVEGGGGGGGGSGAAAVSSASVPAGVTARVSGVELEDGTVLRAPRVLSNAAPAVTFNRLLDQSALPSSFTTHVRHLNVQSGSVKINLALDRIPQFTCRMPAAGRDTIMPHHRGTIHFETNPAQIEAAFADSVAGRMSSRPVIEMTLPTSLDPSLAPPGKHVCLLFCQYAPYDLKDPKGGWSNPDARAAFARNVFKVIEEYAPGFTASIVGEPDILAPPDLERIFGLPGGNIFHAAMGLDQLLWARPVPRWARYRTPVAGLYLAGAGAHPGGGVMGAPGKNAAEVCLSDMQKGRN
jgi:phytoene dehydrogenase-like protein